MKHHSSPQALEPSNPCILFLLVFFLIASAGFLITKNKLPLDGAGQVKMSDFVVYYAVGKIATNTPSKIYDPKLNIEQQSNITVAALENKISPTTYLYPPHTLLFFAPLTYFSFSNAYYLWQTTIILCTFLLVSLLRYAGIGKTAASFLSITILFITSLPWITGIAEGQPMIISTLGILGCHLLAKSKHNLLAGMLLVITTFKPQIIIAPALYLLILHGRQLLLGVIISSVIVFAVCTGIFGISIWQSWLTTMSEAGNDSRFVSLIITKMCNLRNVLFLWFSDKYFATINMISVIIWIISVVISGWIGIMARHKTQKIQELAFALIIATSVFFSPWLHIHTLILLVISVGYLIKYSSPTIYYVLAVCLLVLNPFAVALFLPNLTNAYLDLNLILWIPAQILLIGWLIIKLVTKEKA